MHVQLAVFLCILAVASGRQTLSAKDTSTKKSKAMNIHNWAEMDAEGIEAHDTMSKWLDAFFAATPASDFSVRPPLLPSTRNKSEELPKIEVFTDKEKTEDPRYWKIWRDGTTCDDLIAKKPAIDRKQRKYLVIAPVGSDFNASEWMSHPNHASYDIIALYYGKYDNFTCPLCRAVIQRSGTKWELLRKYIRDQPDEWAQMYQQYEAVMVADDDLIFYNTCKLNRIFEIFTAYGLVLGQPSVCRIDHSLTIWDSLYESTDTPFYSVLRYVTLIEIMAPIYRIDFFKEVAVPSFWNAYTGWGLDLVWTFILRYPKRHVGVIDEVCMFHNHIPADAKGESNLYAVPMPYTAQEEEDRRLAEYGYWVSRVEAMGYPYRNAETLGIVKEVFCRAEHAPKEGQPGFSQESCVRPVVERIRKRRGKFLALFHMIVVAALIVGAVKVIARRKQQLRGAQQAFTGMWQVSRKPSKPYLAGLTS